MCGNESQFGALSFKHRLRSFILGAGNELIVENAAVLGNENLKNY